MQLNAVYLHAPLVGGLIEYVAQLGVDGIARGEGLIKLQLTDYVTQGGLGELFDSVGQVVNLVNGLYGVYNLEVEQGVDACGYVVFGNHVLLGEVVDLLTQVDTWAVLERHAHVALPVGHRVAVVDAPWLFEDGPDDVDTRGEGFVVLTQSLNDAGFGLLDDCQTREHIYHYYNGQCYDYG